jgi:hypothetical protein
MACVRPIIALLEVLYAVKPRGRIAAMDETFTITPAPVAIIAGIAILLARKMLSTFIFITRRQ